MNFFTNTIPDIIFIIDFDKANILKCVSSYLYYLHFGEFPLIDSHARHRFVWLGLGLRFRVRVRVDRGWGADIHFHHFVGWGEWCLKGKVKVRM